jgi:hypothetical protein
MQVDTIQPAITSSNASFNLQPLLNGDLPDVIKVWRASTALKFWPILQEQTHPHLFSIPGHIPGHEAM